MCVTPPGRLLAMAAGLVAVPAQRGERPGTSHAVDMQTVGRLEATHGSLGQRPINAVDATGRGPRTAQIALQAPYGVGPAHFVTRAGVHRSDALRQRSDCLVPSNPVDQQA